jgi:hypothetical protein
VENVPTWYRSCSSNLIPWWSWHHQELYHVISVKACINMQFSTIRLCWNPTSLKCNNLFYNPCTTKQTWPHRTHNSTSQRSCLSSQRCLKQCHDAPRKYMLEKELLSHVQTVIQPVMIEARWHLNASRDLLNGVFFCLSSFFLLTRFPANPHKPKCLIGDGWWFEVYVFV